MVIAIDGPAGAGKSTVARQLAARLRYRYIDSGAMYRAVALLALRRGISLDDAAALESLAAAADIQFVQGDRLLAAGEDLTEAVRSPDVAQAASKVSTVSGVRRELVAQQQQFGKAGGVVMEGRDIGTVVFPGADVKIFLDASIEERARRRIQEIPAGRTLEQVIAEIRERDERDTRRTDSPLIQAPGAHYIDATGLSADEVVGKILVITSKMGPQSA